MYFNFETCLFQGIAHFNGNRKILKNTFNKMQSLDIGPQWRHHTLCRVSHYRPQRSWVKVIFSQACVKNSVHRGGLRRTPPDQADHHPPRTKENPPTRQTTPPGTKDTAAYSQWAASMHPTGMHSCFLVLFMPQFFYKVAHCVGHVTKHFQSLDISALM